MKKVELLAPAGNYDCFLAAIHAGADAVYLGGPKFGARAFADNFTTEEVCNAIEYAHLWNRKIYLTLNTLLKEDELNDVIDYISPFYLSGLDGIIIQDIGVFCTIKDNFPKLEIHCSTQMTITGRYGAEFAKQIGASRIVPARELSLSEIKHIKENVDIEIESFIHGAMCYCYSGQCLFSSIVGGRSGNRGRCAQPCRLPYKTNQSKKESYPLSLKDMCTIDYIPDLIEAGIDSFKIEGRMKKAEYVAGVTGIYRKYIDIYYSDPKADFSVAISDKQVLNKLYIRSQIQDGYYFRHNGKEMVTLEQPGYSGTDEKLLQTIRETYLNEYKKISVSVFASFLLGQKASLTVTKDDFSVTVTGDFVEPSQNTPTSKEQLEKQIKKMGNSPFVCEELWIEKDVNIFYSLKGINELRRTALEQLKQTIISNNCSYNREKIFNHADLTIENTSNEKIKPLQSKIIIEVRTLEQLNAVISSGFSNIIILDSSLFETKNYSDSIFSIINKANDKNQIYISSPYIIRKYDDDFLDKFIKLLNDDLVSGCLVRNIEIYTFLKKNYYSKKILFDSNLYIFNKKTYNFWKSKGVDITLPFELNAGEIKQLHKKGVIGCKVVYGRIPMMITANCIQKTIHSCNKNNESFQLTDRYQVNFPGICDCNHCYNIIYNSKPLSLHKNYKYLQEKMDCKLVFTTETKKETDQVLHFYKQLYYGLDCECPISDYTTGHEKRGVE